MSTRYFALIHGAGASKEKPSGIFRQVDDADSYKLERLERDGEWIMDMELAGYLYKGEPGAVELSASESGAIVEAFLERLRAF